MNQTALAQAGHRSTQRGTLWSIMVLGLLVTAVGGTGIFAVFQDTALQGPNNINSGSRAKAADIQLATGVLLPTGVDCSLSPFTENITTALWNAANIQPGYSETRDVCVENVGSGTVAVFVSVQDAVDSDVLCTGDEATLDATCGQGSGFGSLSSQLDVVVEGFPNCASPGIGGTGPTTYDFVNLEAVQASGLPSLAPGIVKCVRLTVSYPSTTSEAAAQAAQTDAITWKFAFDASSL